MEASSRNIGYDLIRIISIFMVVIIHGSVSYLGGETAPAGYAFIMELCALCLIAVPLFLMVSGALLLDVSERISFSSLFNKRLPKQLIPFLIWSVLYVIARIVTKKIPLSLSAFARLLWEPAYAQFWFMYILLGIYLLLPILQSLVLSLDKRGLEYLLIIWLFFSLTVPTAEALLGHTVLSKHLDFLKVFTYLGYFILGYYLKKYKSETRLSFAAILLASGILLTCISAFLEWKLDESFSGYIYRSYNLPTLALSASGAFLLFSKIEIKNARAVRVISSLSKCTVGVFYVHMLIMAALEHLGLTGKENILLTFAKIALTYIASYAVSLIISAIPKVRGLLLGISEKKREERSL